MKHKAPLWYYPIIVLALLWNLFGVLMFFWHLFLSPEDMAALPEDQRMYMEHMPQSDYIAYGAATIAGLIGSFALLLRRAWAQVVLALSLLAILVNFYDTYSLASQLGIWSSEWMFMPALVIGIGTLLLILAITGRRKNWLS